jgi:hypothetical protein
MSPFLTKGLKCGGSSICVLSDPRATKPDGSNAASSPAMSQDSQTTAAKVIEQIKRLSDAERAQVIHFVQQLAQAPTAANSELIDPPAVAALKKQIKRGLGPRRAHA